MTAAPDDAIHNTGESSMARLSFSHLVWPGPRVFRVVAAADLADVVHLIGEAVRDYNDAGKSANVRMAWANAVLSLRVSRAPTLMNAWSPVLRCRLEQSTRGCEVQCRMITESVGTRVGIIVMLLFYFTVGAMFVADASSVAVALGRVAGFAAVLTGAAVARAVAIAIGQRDERILRCVLWKAVARVVSGTDGHGPYRSPDDATTVR